MTTSKARNPGPYRLGLNVLSLCSCGRVSQPDFPGLKEQTLEMHHEQMHSALLRDLEAAAVVS